MSGAGYPCVDDDHRTPVRRPEHVRAAARRPGQATRARPSARRSTTRRTGSSTRSTSTLAQREHDAFVDAPRRRSGRASTSSRPSSRRPDLVYTFDPLLVTDRGAIPLRPGKPNRRREPAAIEAWTTAAGIPTVGRIEAPGHDRGRRHVLAAAGPVLHRADAADERRRARASWPRWSVATCASSTSRTGAARPSSSTSCRSSRRSPTTSRSSTCRSCRSGCGSCSASSASGSSRSRTRSSRRSAATSSRSGPGVVILAEGNPRTAAALAAAGCEVHTYPATEIGINGSGGPTCMTRPILRG